MPAPEARTTERQSTPERASGASGLMGWRCTSGSGPPLPASMHRCSRENATAIASPAFLVCHSKRCSLLPVTTDHRATVFSSPPVRIKHPSGEKATGARDMGNWTVRCGRSCRLGTGAPPPVCFRSAVRCGRSCRGWTGAPPPNISKMRIRIVIFILTTWKVIAHHRERRETRRR